jgi:hypothetical protein
MNNKTLLCTINVLGYIERKITFDLPLSDDEFEAMAPSSDASFERIPRASRGAWSEDTEDMHPEQQTPKKPRTVTSHDPPPTRSRSAL